MGDKDNYGGRCRIIGVCVREREREREREGGREGEGGIEKERGRELGVKGQGV